MSDDKREWTTKQYAMELYVRGLAVSQGQAVSMAAQFEREWRPEAARIDAESHTWGLLASGKHPDVTPFPPPTAPEETRAAWMKSALKAVRAAGRKAHESASESVW